MHKSTKTTEKTLKRIYTEMSKIDTENRPFYIPISGGTDSALTFYIYSQMYPTRTFGVYFGNKLPFEKWFTKHGKIIKETRWEVPDMEIARWAKLLDKANKDGAIIIGTRNKTEHLLGTFSHASRLAFHMPIVSLFKNEVLKISEDIGCPKIMIEKSRRPDSDCGRYKEYTKIGIEKIDEYVDLLSKNKISKDLLKSSPFLYIKELYDKNGYKKNLPLLI